MARVLVCDSHSAIQKALERQIAEAPGLEFVGTCDSAETLVAILADEHVDVLVLEITLPGAVGVDLIRQLRDRLPDLRIIVYSMYDEVIYAARVIRAGASGYVTKTHTSKHVLRAIRAALRGERFHSDAVASQLRSLTGPSLHPTNELSDREMSVFQLLGEGLSSETIASRLGITRNDVEDLETQSVAKLGLESREALVQYASQVVHR